MIIRLLAGIIKSKLFWATLVIGLLFFTWRPQKELGPEIPIGQAGMTLLGSKIVGWKDNQPRWEVKAKTIWRSKDEKLIIFQEIQEAMIYQFKEDGTREEELFFTAPWARMEMRSNLLKIGGGIKGRIKQGKFETEEAEVNTKSEEIKTLGSILFSKGDLRIEAHRMEGNLDSEVLNFFGEILLQDMDYRARGSYLQYFGAEERYILEEKVEVEMEF